MKIRAGLRPAQLFLPPHVSFVPRKKTHCCHHLLGSTARAFGEGFGGTEALALGADAVCVGRPYVYGLGAFGQAGVEKVLSILRTEFRRVVLVSRDSPKGAFVDPRDGAFQTRQLQILEVVMLLIDKNGHLDLKMLSHRRPACA